MFIDTFTLAGIITAAAVVTVMLVLVNGHSNR